MGLFDWYRHWRSGKIVPSKKAESWAEQQFGNRPTKIAAKVLEILAAHIGVPFDRLTPHARFIEDLNCVDLEGIEIIMSIEDEFDFKIPDADTELIQTIDDLIRYVEKRKVQPIAPPNSEPAAGSS